jgi:uncharacterized phage infection (PIP) family protein YhgE
MLLNARVGGHQSNMEALKAIYERTHNSYIAMFTTVLVLVASIIGGLITSLLNPQNFANIIFTVASVAIVMLLLVIGILASRLNRLQRDYLDILMVYNLLSIYF